jgi:hypothetical protein
MLLLISWDCIVIGEQRIEDIVDGSTHGLLWGTVQAFGWIVWGKPQKSFIRIASLWASNCSWDFPNTKQRFYILETFMFFITSLPVPICCTHVCTIFEHPLDYERNLCLFSLRQCNSLCCEWFCVLFEKWFWWQNNKEGIVAIFFTRSEPVQLLPVGKGQSVYSIILTLKMNWRHALRISCLQFTSRTLICNEHVCEVRCMSANPRQLFATLSLSMVNKNLTPSAVHWTKTRGPHVIANWNSNDRCTACQCANGLGKEWCELSNKAQWNPVKKILKIPRKSYFLSGKLLKSVILMKWENFGAFLSWLLRQEIFLTRFFLSEFHCNIPVYGYSLIKLNSISQSNMFWLFSSHI